ncbi:MAG TPA: hypothetical protein VFW90_01360 [Candidatus Saccharimonadales bacterium]|nr:hypothetical protein [Candidatus Saccharimonadales bacterium]
MAYSPDQLPPTPDYAHPLYAVIDGEVVSLEGHIDQGVTAVLNGLARVRGLEPTDLPKPIELFSSPEEAEGMLQ